MNAVTRFTLDMWFKLVRKSKLEEELRLLRWIAYDRQFIPGTLDQRFKQWILYGIRAIFIVIKDGSVMTFQEMKDKYINIH